MKKFFAKGQTKDYRSKVIYTTTAYKNLFDRLINYV